MNVCIIANPASGAGRGAQLAEEIRKALAPRVETVEVAVTGACGDAERIAHEVRADCVVSVGGDGTANEILNGMNDRVRTLAIYPAGTANVVARQLGIRRNIAAFAELVARRSVRHIDGGTANGRKFLLGIGAGLDAMIAKQVAARQDGARGLGRGERGRRVRALRTPRDAPLRRRSVRSAPGEGPASAAACRVRRASRRKRERRALWSPLPCFC